MIKKIDLFIIIINIIFFAYYGIQLLVFTDEFALNNLGFFNHAVAGLSEIIGIIFLSFVVALITIIFKGIAEGQVGWGNELNLKIDRLSLENSGEYAFSFQMDNLELFKNDDSLSINNFSGKFGNAPINGELLYFQKESKIYKKKLKSFNQKKEKNLSW